jgi:hypothetical protein
MAALFQEAAALATSVKAGDVIQTSQFLEICRLVVSVVGKHYQSVYSVFECCSSGYTYHVTADKLGTAFSLVHTDITGNVQVCLI